MLAYIFTERGLSVLANGVLTILAKDDPRFNDAAAVVTDRAETEETKEQALLTVLAPPVVQLRSALQNLSLTISSDGDAVYYNGQPVDNSLTRRMLQYLRDGTDVSTLVPFLENLLQNPSYRAVQDLYEFLERGNIPLTVDGDFLAYKAVRDDWKDIHSGTFDNSIGKVVEIPRNQVDEDPDQTCSRGLHVCSFEYLPSFAHADGHVVIVKINPKDVVAIPRDYNLSKMRVCRYEVIGEVEGYYDQRRNVLAERAFYDGENDFWAAKAWLDGEDFRPADAEPESDVDYARFEAQVYTSTEVLWVSAEFNEMRQAKEWVGGWLDSATPEAVIIDRVAGGEVTLRYEG